MSSQWCNRIQHAREPHAPRSLVMSQRAFPFGPREVSTVIGKLGRLKLTPGNGQIGLGSRVRIMDLDSGETCVVELVRPLEADPEARRISIYSPLGKELLGARVGQTVQVPLFGNRFRVQVLPAAADTPDL